MLISSATARAFDDVANRERDVLRAYTPGAFPDRSDTAAPQRARFTLDPLSVAAPPDAYFVSSDERGRASYTRDGGFAFANGTLVDGDGHPVLGYHDPSSPLGELRADPVDVALGLTQDVQIDGDGAVSYAKPTVDPRTGARENARVTIGQIALARFTAATKLQPLDATHASAPVGVTPHLGRAGDGNFALLRTHAVEQSHVDIGAGLQRLQEAYLALDALRSAELAQDKTKKTTMDLLK